MAGSLRDWLAPLIWLLCLCWPAQPLTQQPENLAELWTHYKLATATISAPPAEAGICNATQRATADKLNALVATAGSRAHMFLIGHDAQSISIAKEISACYSSSAWFHIQQITSTPFFESILYTEVLETQSAVWRELDYVITGTYKTVSGRVRRWERVQTFEEITRLLHVARQGGWDVVPFLRSGSGMMSNCLYWHKKGFKLAWDALLGAMNYSYPSIRQHYEMKPFFRNVYIIKPSVLEGLIKFMKTALLVAQQDKHVAALLAKDSHYKEGSADVSRRIFGTDYYQLHPFIFERLPAFYLHHAKASICSADQGECAYNT